MQTYIPKSFFIIGNIITRNIISLLINRLNYKIEYKKKGCIFLKLLISQMLHYIKKRHTYIYVIYLPVYISRKHEG